ncbi:hypothetical protein [Fonticella tunisiensis]|uniref:Uncharacterized protein n=1 Tax=Fonticella tunisiensis TaxID=1096341 RepID=A0A4V3EUC9_9CLOT|nr:hypothetical protein [Fonticella tunisiensis]TDT63445.1 hypothetical protein EDD71_102207 [Fonticella tunisiensis]
MKGFDNFFDKIYSILTTLVYGISRISWIALVTMLCISGILLLIGNEHAARKLCRNALYGFGLIQLANMLL